VAGLVEFGLVYELVVGFLDVVAGSCDFSEGADFGVALVEYWAPCSGVVCGNDSVALSNDVVPGVSVFPDFAFHA